MTRRKIRRTSSGSRANDVIGAIDVYFQTSIGRQNRRRQRHQNDDDNIIYLMSEQNKNRMTDCLASTYYLFFHIIIIIIIIINLKLFFICRYRINNRLIITDKYIY